MQTIEKICPKHLEKIAYVYLRQSSMSQVRNHRESTERQYALKEKARSLGWPLARIHVLDGDLGKSGTSTNDRTDIKALVADVSLGKAGAVLAIEASRLARSNGGVWIERHDVVERPSRFRQLHSYSGYTPPFPLYRDVTRRPQQPQTNRPCSNANPSRRGPAIIASLWCV